MRALSLILLCSIALLLAGLGLESSGALYPAVHFMSSAQASPREWFEALHLRTNAFQFWRADSILSWTGSIYPGTDIERELAFGGLLVFCAGLTLLHLRLTKHRMPLVSGLTAFSASMALLIIFGWDAMLFPALSWLPFFILTILALILAGSSAGVFFVFGLFFAVRIAASANAQAPLIILTGLLSSALIAHLGRSRGSSVCSRKLGLFAVLTLAIASLPVMEAPTVNTQEYPYMAHVVSESDVYSTIRPLIGPGSAIPFIDRDTLAAFGAPLLTLILVLAVAALTVRSIRELPFSRLTLIAAAGLACSALFDVLLPDELSIIAPLAAVSRIVPGTFLTAPSEFGLALSLIFLLFGLSVRLPVTVVGAVAGVVALAALPLQKSLDRVHYDFSRVPPEYERLVLSPSFPIVHELGLWVLDAQERVEGTVFARSNSIPMTANVSHLKPGNEPEKMFDLDRRSRWSAGRALQLGDEWVYVRFGDRQRLTGVELSPSAFKSDFPRALRVSIVPDCPAEVSPDLRRQAAERPLVQFVPWHGSLDFTPKGFPFYSRRTRVQAFFPDELSTQCLLIEQLGVSSKVDWSIAEFRPGFLQTGTEAVAVEADPEEEDDFPLAEKSKR